MGEPTLEDVGANVGRACAEASARSLRDYLELVRIDGSHGPRCFGACAEPWQRRSLWPIMTAVEAACGMNEAYAGPRCFWRDLPQGHDKSSGIARILNGAVAFSRKTIRAGCFAKDTQQAKRIWQFMKDEARLNPWIAAQLDFLQSPHFRVRNKYTGSELEIFDADFEGNAGHKLDVTICEELTWWPAKAKNLFDQLYSRRQKIGRSVFIILGNAGMKKTWQWALKCEAERDPTTWDYYRTEGSVAGWMDPRQLERDRRNLSPSMAARLIDNRWIDEDENAYLYRTDVEACVARARELGMVPYEAPVPGIKYAGTIDAAISKDYAVVTICGLFPDDSVRAASMDVFDRRTFPGGKIPLALIESTAVKRHRQFNASWLIDPYQMEWFCQKYEGVWPLERMVYRGGLTNLAVAEQVKTLIMAQLLLWPEHMGLLHVPDETGEVRPYTIADEFCDLVVKEMPTYGWRWDHKAQKHDDRAMTLGMGAYHLLKVDTSGPFGDDREAAKLEQPKDGPLYDTQEEKDFTVWRAW